MLLQSSALTGCACVHAHLYLGLCLCVRVIVISAPPCPALHALPPHCSASPPARAESAAGARRKSSSLRCVGGESKQEAHKRRKCCFPHAGSSWVSRTLLVHNISFSHRVPFAVTHNTSALCSCSVRMLM